MSEPEILYPAIFVFSMMMIGLLLTIWEFSRMHKQETRGRKDNPAGAPEYEDTDARVRKASGF
jgi:hypothetical protein